MHRSHSFVRAVLLALMVASTNIFAPLPKHREARAGSMRSAGAHALVVNAR